MASLRLVSWCLGVLLALAPSHADISSESWGQDWPHVLVTGGAGYIGSHTTLRLLEAGYEVTVVDNLVNSSPESLNRVANLTGLGARLHFFELDVRDRPALQQLLAALTASSGRPLHACVHFAGLKAVGESTQKPLLYYDANVGSSVALLDELQTAGCRRLIFSSSATVYGDAASPITEATPTGQGITNAYGRTKFVVEEMLRDFSASPAGDAWGLVVLRYFNPAGAHPSGRIGEDPSGPPNNLMPYVAQVAVGRRPFLTVFGDDYETPDGTGVRDYIHIMDLAEGHVAALQLLGPSDDAVPATHAGEVATVNLGTGTGASVLEMVAAMEAACGCKVAYQLAPRRPGDLSTVYAATAKAAELLGWRATRTLPEMAADLWRWQASNPNGYPPNATFFRDDGKRPSSGGSGSSGSTAARPVRGVLAAARAVSRAVASSLRAVARTMRRAKPPARGSAPGEALPLEELEEL